MKRCQASDISVISIHALLAESDGGCVAGNWPRVTFLSTLSLRRATNTLICFYPHCPISIHALLAESDAETAKTSIGDIQFLSTLSLRRATFIDTSKDIIKANFYPRSPCGERLWANFNGFYWWVISIHALLAESDLRLMCFWLCGRLFLSTLSLRRATSPCCGWLEVIYYFYPRSPCGERQKISENQYMQTSDFYPRSPCGERPERLCNALEHLHFYPRSPCGERQQRT